jgi:hypothetical protein
MRHYDYPKMAAFIVDAMVFGMTRSCEMHAISSGTGKRWRKLFETDPKLQAAVRKLKVKVIEPVVPTAVKTVNALLEWLEDLPKHIDQPTAGIISAITDSYRAIEEIQIAKQMIEVKLKTLQGGGQVPSLKQLEQETIEAIATETR